MASCSEISLRGFTTTNEVSYRLLLFGRRLHNGEQSRLVQFAEFSCVTAIRLHALARLSRDESGGDNLADEWPRGLDLPLQGVPAAASLVHQADLAWRLALDLLQETSNRGGFVLQPRFDELLLARDTHGCGNELLVRVQPYPGDTICHDRLLSLAALTPRVNPRPQA